MASPNSCRRSSAFHLLYATDCREVDGIMIPTTRRGYAWQGDYQLVPEPLLVAIDMREITIR